MTRLRLDQQLVVRGLAATRSQAENYIKLGYVLVDGKTVVKAGHQILPNTKITLKKISHFVSRAGYKLESANNKFNVAFKNKVVLDAGSSTGGFSDYALQQGAKKIIAVDVGTDQLHPKLRQNSAVEVHEKTDIRGFKPTTPPDIILVDLSFISLRQILPHLAKIATPKTKLIVMVKPQFEAKKEQINRGVVKNDRVRRQILRDFESWVKNLFKTIDKTDSEISGEKGNIERFYQLRKLA